MITYIYDVLFGYITFLFFFEEHSAIIVHKEVAEKIRRSDCVAGLLRFRHPRFRHPVCIKPMMT